MPSRYSPDTVLEDSEQIIRVWTENPAFALGEVTLVIMQGKIDALRQKRERIEMLRTELTALQNDLGAQTRELANINTRARSGYRAQFGPDSSQYEQVGGTRTSERKRPTRKATPPVAK